MTPICATVVEVNDEGHRRLQFSGTPDIRRELDRLGEVPLPPYITRANPDEMGEDKERYQTIYARTDGSVAAPTAGLHFTGKLLDEIRARGVKICFVTLHIGPGTFAPVKTETLAAHKMHEERFELGEETVHAVNEAKSAGRRVFAVGTTTVRVLESIAAGKQRKTQCLQGSDAHFYLSAVSISNRGRAVDKLPSALLHLADARQRVCRAG